MPSAVAKRLGNPAWVRGGKSPNPGGRPKAVVDVTELARSYTEQAVRALVEALRDLRHKVAAAEALLSRGWGRPVQSVATDGSLSVVGLHLLAATRIGQELAAELETRTTIDVRAEPAAGVDLLQQLPTE